MPISTVLLQQSGDPASRSPPPPHTPLVHFQEPPADILTPSKPSKPGRGWFLDGEACLAALLQPKGSGSRGPETEPPQIQLWDMSVMLKQARAHMGKT